jgi:hypothetical protein
MVQQQCTRCGFRTQASACENCGSAALDVEVAAQAAAPGPTPAGGADLLNATVGRTRWDLGAQPVRDSPAVP